MRKNYEISIKLLNVSDEHFVQLVNLLDVVFELLEMAGVQVLFTAEPFEIDEDELEHEIEIAFSKKTG